MVAGTIGCPPAFAAAGPIKMVSRAAETNSTRPCQSRSIAVAAGSIVNTILSILLLGNELTASFVIGGLITLVSAHAYRNFSVQKSPGEKEGDIDDGNPDKEVKGKGKSIMFYAVILVPLLLLPMFSMIEPRLIEALSLQCEPQL